jgi:hypothetical protein
MQSMPSATIRCFDALFVPHLRPDAVATTQELHSFAGPHVGVSCGAQRDYTGVPGTSPQSLPEEEFETAVSGSTYLCSGLPPPGQAPVLPCLGWLAQFVGPGPWGLGGSLHSRHPDMLAGLCSCAPLRLFPTLNLQSASLVSMGRVNRLPAVPRLTMCDQVSPHTLANQEHSTPARFRGFSTPGAHLQRLRRVACMPAAARPSSHSQCLQHRSKRVNLLWVHTSMWCVQHVHHCCNS